MPAQEAATDTVSSGTRSRASWRDPLLPVCAAAALLVYLPHGFDGYLTRDLALYSYAGQQVAEGVPPYLGVTNRAGPLAHAVPGLGAAVARAVGVDDVLGMRGLFMLLSVAGIAAAYLLGRDVFRSRAAGLVSAATLLSIEGFISYATYGPREKTTMVLLLLCAMVAMTHRRWATTGAFIALATLTWQPVFLAAIAGTAAAVWVSERAGRLRALVRVAVGGAVPTLLVLAAYAVIDALDVFLDNFVLINAGYTRQVSLASDPELVWEFMVEGYGPSLLVFVVGLLALVALAARALARPAARDDSFPMLMAGLVMLGTGLALMLMAFNGFPDAFFLLPAAGLGLGGTVAALFAASPRAGTAATAVVCAGCLVLALLFSIGNRDHTLEEQRADVAAVLDVLPADATFLSVEAPQPLVLAQERNLTRFQLFGNGLIDYLDDTWPGGRDGYARHVVGLEPTVIALGGLDEPEWLTRHLGDYRLVGESTGWEWYVREDLGAPTLRALRAALG